MSEHVTVAMLKGLLDAFNRHDLDAIMAYFADEWVFYMPRGAEPRGDRYIGKARLMQQAQRVAAAIRNSGVQCEGVNLFLADGEAAMQEVLHVHLHVFPRFAGDGFGLRFGPHYKELPSRQSLEDVGAQITRALGSLPPAPSDNR